MWWCLQNPLVRLAVIALVIIGLSESMFCAALHVAIHHHDEVEYGSSAEEDGHHCHEESCEKAVVFCQCPDGHDCDHCDSHHHVAIRSDRSVKILDQISVVLSTPIALDVSILEVSCSQETVWIDPPPKRFFRSIHSTVLLI